MDPSVTNPAEPDPVDNFPLPSENLVSPVPSEFFLILPGYSYASPVTVRFDFKIPARVFLKKKKTNKNSNKNKYKSQKL